MRRIILMLITLTYTVTGLNAEPYWWHAKIPKKYKELFDRLVPYPYKHRNSSKTLKTPWFENTTDTPDVGNIQPYLHEKRININYKDPVDGTTIAHWMARHKGYRYHDSPCWRLRLLNAAQADFAVTDKAGRNCLHHAVLGDIQENIAFFLNEIDYANDLMSAHDTNGRTPYDLAVAYLGEDSPITQRLATWLGIGTDDQEAINNSMEDEDHEWDLDDA